MYFYLSFSFSGFKVADKRTINLFEDSEDFVLSTGWIEKYEPVLSKSDSSWDNSYCVRLVIVSLDVNLGRL